MHLDLDRTVECGVVIGIEVRNARAYLNELN